mmetsp:Transcript_14926/g.27577  ORF Transcript_14926/g.27577 Transcript_14926/m.27577 type:complete len:120 (-) Transcript_14926:1745-2104(-)|eukprot:CAMPEP_0204905544 /NCGR_PEP_ID=MMETSP1397-20131031/5477_1 /ASSEMBLY_ACC=CAM_ASM_000891 /TAXON_ID=49980 /ORGANISM="Climacostomum Climacostomum virens, Strain Stock W-24" /LENGTH=119 /DNA_ID=CAMNT_0052074429 /DNA_START=297 /DNA_END=656 /DNA_ORIENTATION=-
MEEQVFLFYSGVAYLAAAFVGSLYAAYKEYKLTHPDEVVKPEKKQRSSFPVGKIAYCKPCDRYLLDDDKLLEHQRGTRHRERASGNKQAIEWRPEAEAKSNPEKVRAQGHPSGTSGKKR